MARAQSATSSHRPSVRARLSILVGRDSVEPGKAVCFKDNVFPHLDRVSAHQAMPAEITAQCLTTYVSSVIVAVFSLEAAPRRLCFSCGELLDHFSNKRRDVGRSTGDQAVDDHDFLFQRRSHGSSRRYGPPARTSGCAIKREPEHPPAPVVSDQSPPRVRVPERNGGLIPGRLRHLDLFKENATRLRLFLHVFLPVALGKERVEFGLMIPH